MASCFLRAVSIPTLHEIQGFSRLSATLLPSSQVDAPPRTLNLRSFRPSGFPASAHAVPQPGVPLSTPSFVLSSGFISWGTFHLKSLAWTRCLCYQVLISYTIVGVMILSLQCEILEGTDFSFIYDAFGVPLSGCLAFGVWCKLLNEWMATFAVECVTLLDFHSFLRMDTYHVCGSRLNISHSSWTSQALCKCTANVILEVDACIYAGIFTHQQITRIWINWNISLLRNSRYRQTLPFRHIQLSHIFEQQIH